MSTLTINIKIITMSTKDLLFPASAHDIPEEYRFNPLDQNDFLSGGSMVTMHGINTVVTSPIFIGGNTTYLGSYPNMTAGESKLVLQHAKRAYNDGKGKWPMMSPQERISAIQNVVNAIRAERQIVINSLMWEICKEKALAEDEFDRTLKYIEETIVKYEAMTSKQLRAPRGVVLCVGPFNYPMNEIFEPMFASLICGNVVIYKHAKYGILLMYPFLKYFQSLLPAGVINTVYGLGENTITPIMEQQSLQGLVFIGSTKVADIVMNANKQPHGFHAILGLGAKNVVVVTEHCDVDACIKEWVVSALGFNGQRCTAGKMFKVHRSQYEEFTTKFAAAVDELQIGMPWDVRTKDGPLITPLPETNKVNDMRSYIDDAVSQGAVVLTKNEYYGETIMRPVVLGRVTQGMKIYYEEQFGPVVPISIYDTINEIVEYIIGTKCGQQIAIYDTTTKGNADKKNMYKRLFQNQVCHIQFNRPCSRGNGTVAFTGRQNSAKGVLSLEDALLEFSLPVEVSGD